MTVTVKRNMAFGKVSLLLLGWSLLAGTGWLTTQIARDGADGGEFGWGLLLAVLCLVVGMVMLLVASEADFWDDEDGEVSVGAFFFCAGWIAFGVLARLVPLDGPAAVYALPAVAMLLGGLLVWGFWREPRNVVENTAMSTVRPGSFSSGGGTAI